MVPTTRLFPAAEPLWKRPVAGLLLALAGPLLLLTGCTNVDDPAVGAEAPGDQVVLLSGRTHVAEAGSAIALDAAGRLQVTGSDVKAIFIRTQGDARADFHFQPVGVGPGGLFAAEIVGREAGRTVTLARVVHRATASTPAGMSKRIEADMSGMGASLITAQFYNDGRLLSRQENLAAEANRTVIIGTTLADPTSYHYVREGGVTRVIVDYDKDKPGAVTPPDGTGPLLCTHIELIPVWHSSGRLASAASISGVRLAGTRTSDITITRERFAGPAR
jgi:hypothetical protein